jgi:hypothetical protein
LKEESVKGIDRNSLWGELNIRKGNSGSREFWHKVLDLFGGFFSGDWGDFGLELERGVSNDQARLVRDY